MQPIHRTRQLTVDWWGWGGALVLVLVYGLTASKTLSGYGDGDELIGMAYGWGLAHPPGYPELLGLMHGIVRLMPGSFIWASNALSGVFGALALLIGFFLSKRLIEDFYPEAKEKAIRGVSLMVVFLVGLSFYVWQASVNSEALPMNTILTMLSVGATAWVTKQMQRADGFYRRVAVWSGVMAVTLVHHQLSWPALFILIVYTGYRVYHKTKRKTFFASAGIWLAIIAGVLAAHLTLMNFLANRATLWSWDMEPGFAGLKAYFMREIYSGFSAESMGMIAGFWKGIDWALVPEQLKNYWLTFLVPSLSWPGTILLMIGVYHWWRRRQTGNAFWHIFILLTLLYTLGMGIYLPVPGQTQALADWQQFVLVSRFYTLGLVLSVPLIGLGLASLMVRKRYRAIGMGLAVWLGLVIGINGWQHGRFFGGDEAKLQQSIASAVTELPANSSIYCFSDVSCFSLLAYTTLHEDALAEDLAIVPVTPQLNAFGRREGNQDTLTYPDNPFRVAAMAAEEVALGRGVYLMELPELYYLWLGMDESAYGLEPWDWGYALTCESEAGLDDRLTVEPTVESPTSLRSNRGLIERMLYDWQRHDRYRLAEPGYSCLTGEEHIEAANGLREEGLYVEALRQQYFAVLKQPDRVDYRFGYAQLLEITGNVELAGREYRWVARLDESNTEAKIKSEQLPKLTDQF